VDGVPEEARRCFEQGYQAQMAGDLDGAIEWYGRSIAIHPTAEAHTFLGWTYSFQRRWQDAIAACRRAIDVDPAFGNPYNDIGVYLIELGRPDEAIPWLERAKRAPRYEPRHFPHINLARIYAAQQKVHAAVRELEAAAGLAPDSRAIRQEIHRLLGRLN
jgi:tetratricopeptide (TPR) repeat protein